SSIARDLFTQTRFGGFGLVSKLIDLRRMFARSLHGLLLRCLLARELIAQRIALLFEGGDTSLQRRAFGLRLPHNLYQLPDTGRSGNEILQHERYRKPSRGKVERG